MRDFLRDNWLWIVLPFVLILVGLGVIIAVSEQDPASSFVYTIR